VEMLVSLALLAMLAAMLLSGLQTVGRFVNRSSSQVDADDDVVSAQRLLRDRVEQLRAVSDPNSANPIVDAAGNENNFAFVAPPLARSEPDSLWRYRIKMNATGDLVLFTANTLDDRYSFYTSDLQGWRPVVIQRGIQSIRINYFGERRNGRGSAWQVLWLQRPQPPVLVRISVTYKPGDSRVWPDLIIRPRANENTACKIDLLSGRCGDTS
jgi:general secretion pathway protein J